MINFNTEKKHSSRNWLLDAVIIFIIGAVLTASLYLIFEKKYKNKIYPGVTAGGIDLGGKTREQAEAIINKKINKLSQDGIMFYYRDNKTTITPIISALNPDLAYRIIDFNAEKTVAEAFAFGRNKNFFVNLRNKIHAAAFKRPIAFNVTVNEKEIKQILKNNFKKFETPAKNAKLTYDKQTLPNGEEEIRFIVREDKPGKTINYDKGINRLKKRLARINGDPIELFAKTEYPEIYKKDALNIESKARKILNAAPFALKYENNEWKITKERLASWLVLRTNRNYEKSKEESKVIIGLDEPSIKRYLLEEVAPAINKSPLDAKFEVKNGRVTEFQAGYDGIKLDIGNSLTKIKSIIASNKGEAIELTAKKIKNNNSLENINDFGIKEIIGTGSSDFAGSPKNRRHNIAVGADTLNGILIKPGEEFSLMGALGEIDAQSGYLPELVIKGDKTVAEYGGGLCQIGTTMFRAALASGLPITQRRNHSYRVSYYEPAGTDATIYDPWPDFRFLNDTGNHILIQSRIEGDKLYFDFWGTKDGRSVSQTDPVIYNIVKPGPTKLIETLSLPPGKKKCTERAHSGADAYFDYKVSYPNGEVKEKRFNSHYVPWREVCLIGVEKLSENNNAATSTKNTTN